MEGVWRVPVEKELKPEQMARVLDELHKIDPLAWLAAITAANAALRLCECYHLRAEDILPDFRMRVTIRKKKVLQPEVIGVSKGLYPLLNQRALEVKSGWLFPGKSTPCLIERRPTFKVYACPDCGKQIADPALYRKSADLQRLFQAHLVESDKWELKDAMDWIKMASKSVKEVPVNCTGGHMSGRHIQTCWKFATAAAGVVMKGRGFHTTKHYSITNFVEANPGLNPKVYQSFAHHSSLDMTMRYNHPAELEKKVQDMPPTLGGSH
jgi:integrase